MRVSVPEVPERRFADRVDPPRVPGVASAGSSTKPQWSTASLTPLVLPRISVDSSDVNSRPKAAVLPPGGASAFKGLNVPPEQLQMPQPRYPEIFMPRFRDDPDDVASPDRSPRSQSTPEARPDDGSTAPR
jgi:hypothetical protein